MEIRTLSGDTQFFELIRYLSQAISTRKQGLKKYMTKHLCASERPYKWSPPIFGYLWPGTSRDRLPAKTQVIELRAMKFEIPFSGIGAKNTAKAQLFPPCWHRKNKNISWPYQERKVRRHSTRFNYSSFCGRPQAQNTEYTPPPNIQFAATSDFSNPSLQPNQWQPCI